MTMYLGSNAVAPTKNVSSGSTTITELNVTQNGTYTAPAGTAYSPVNVEVSGGGSPTISPLSVTPSTSEQTFNSSSVDGYKPVVVSAMPSGSVTAPSSISGTSASVSTGTNTLTLTKSVSVTPNVTTVGYISSGTAGNSSVSLTASVTTKAAATITPGTSDQTIASGTYLTGTQTISGDADLVAGNIKKDVSIFGVTGTYEGSGGGGATNFVSGSFTTNSSSGAQSISIPYTGTGYPIYCCVEVDGGYYNSGTTWYTTVQRYLIGLFIISKRFPATTPTYTTSGDVNTATTICRYKSSTSSATSYSSGAGTSINTFSSAAAAASNTTGVRFTGNKALSVYVAASSYGLKTSTKYNYFVVYSS